jgi:LAO/AO transport system kinase
VTTAGPAPDVAALVKGVLGGVRTDIARAITLVESKRDDHRVLAQGLLAELVPHSGSARRVGISGVPGVGKSTFVDAMGSLLVARGHRVAVLAVDPSSGRTGGSILGDKTRMARLASDERAFIRPSPSGATLGGVAAATREAIVVMEAAGYDVVLVETVGVGQSETVVSEMTDTFLLLALARTGDQLQGIKKGVLELADVVAVNKADGEHAIEAQKAARELAGALRLLGAPAEGVWSPPVLTCSALTGDGLEELWQELDRHLAAMTASGELAARRQRQQVEWTWALVQDRLLSRLRSDPAVRALTPDLLERVRSGAEIPSTAAGRILDAFLPPSPS